MQQQNVDLRRRLDEEHNNYKRKLTAFQEGQQRQAQLVEKLQAKVSHLYTMLFSRSSAFTQRVQFDDVVFAANCPLFDIVHSNLCGLYPFSDAVDCLFCSKRGGEYSRTGV